MLDLILPVVGITLFAVLPIFFWRRTRELGLPFFLLYLLFTVLVQKLVLGHQTACHDAFASFHFYFNLLRQWQDAGMALDWNPYLGAGQPFSVISNLIFWAPALILAEAFSLFGIQLRPTSFSNLIFLGYHFQTCTGLVLLLQLLYKDRFISIFGGLTYLLSGAFFNNLHQPWPLLLAAPLPYLLFFLIHSLKTRTWIGLILFSLWFGEAVNHYIPVYLGLLLLLAFLIWAAHPVPFSKWAVGLWRRKSGTKLALCGILFCLTAGPMLHSYAEQKDFVSPTRAMSLKENSSASETGPQTPVEAYLPGYRVLFDPTLHAPEFNPPGWNHGSYRKWHHGFYLGMTAFLLLPLAGVGVLKSPVQRTLVGTTLGIMILGAGQSTPVWGWVVEHLPFAHYIRHPAPFASAASFLLIVAAMGGLKSFLSSAPPRGFKVLALALSGGILFLFGTFLNFYSLLFFILLWWGMIAFAGAIRPADLKRYRFLGGVFLLLFNLGDLGMFSYQSVSTFCRLNAPPFQEIAYPRTWKSVCTSCCEYVPFQIYPVVEKKIIWSHPLDNYIFMLQKDFAEQLLDPIRTGGPFQGKLFYLMDTAPEPDSDRGPLTPVSASASPVPRKRVPGRVQQHPSKNPNRVEVTVKADRQTSLLRLENYHPGWTVYIDGREGRIERVPPNFQKVVVPAGTHRVRFEFQTLYPHLVRISTTAYLIGWGLLWLWLQRGTPGESRFLRQGFRIRLRKGS